MPQANSQGAARLKLKNKVALVVGCSPSINAGIALSLAEAGARLVCADIVPAFGQACAEGAQHEVTGGMTMVIVHRLEGVEIHDSDETPTGVANA